jgi:hypothetical protein
VVVAGSCPDDLASKGVADCRASAARKASVVEDFSEGLWNMISSPRQREHPACHL